MEFYDVIEKRRTVRDLKVDVIPDEILKRVLAAGIKAPTHNHQREWNFIILRTQAEKDNALAFAKKFAENYQAGVLPPNATPKQRMYFDAVPKQYAMLNHSGAVVLAFFKATRALFDATNVSGLNAFAAAWCCVENIFLAATAEDLAYSMRIPVGDEGERVAAAVGAPDGWMMACYIGLGYPKSDAVVLEQVNRELKGQLHFGRW